MAPYEIFMRLEVMEDLRSIRGTQKFRLTTFIDSLASDPFQKGDYSDHDESLREIEIKIIGQFALTYWADHPANEIKIVDIRRADLG